MQYLPALLTPFLAALPENSYRLQIDRSQISTTLPKLNSSLSYSSKLFVVVKKLNSFAINQIRTLSQKHPEWGAVCTGVALSTAHDSLPAFSSLLFSRAYKPLPPHHRFASHAFSRTYKSLFSQILSFHINTNCPGVTPSEAFSVVSVFSVLNSLLLSFSF